MFIFTTQKLFNIAGNLVQADILVQCEHFGESLGNSPINSRVEFLNFWRFRKIPFILREAQIID